MTPMRIILSGLLCWCSVQTAFSQTEIGTLTATPSSALLATGTCRVLDPQLQTRYTGPCSGDGWAHGVGKATGAAAQYEGRFVFGAKQGFGVKKWNDTGDRYEGDFFQDARQGNGMYIWGDASSAHGSRYVGQFQNDLRHGQGSFYWGNGDAVHGQWDRGKQLAPASAMQSLQILHSQSVEVSTAIGQAVCSHVFTSDVQKQVRGIVVSRSGNTLGVRLAQQPFASKATEQPVVISLVTDWWPC